MMNGLRRVSLLEAEVWYLIVESLLHLSAGLITQQLLLLIAIAAAKNWRVNRVFLNGVYDRQK